MSKSPVELSVIVPVSERQDDVQQLYSEYRAAIESTGKTFEMIYVLDGVLPDTMGILESLQRSGEPLKIIQLTQSFGEAAALTVGFERAAGDVIVTLPSYYQVEPEDVGGLIAALGENDMVIGRRWPRQDAGLKQLQTRTFHAILHFVSDTQFRDLGCGARVFRRQVIEEITLYGDQHRFLPVIAEKRGFRVEEIDIAQSGRDAAPQFYKSGVYLRRILDILTIFFLVKFTKKPLRFFGLIGSAIFALGGLVLAYVVTQRLFFDVSLADRPALLLSSLFVVLGVQLFALGLIGELIIFTHAREIKEYTIDKIIG